MPQKSSKPRWSKERRLEFMEFRLYWDGRINRGDLIDYFGISVPQASSDLALYQEVAEGNIFYDKTAKTYVAASCFRPKFFDPSADRYLADLRLLSDSLLGEDESWVRETAPYAIVPVLRRRIEPNILRSVIDAIRSGSSIEVNYQSVSSTEPKWRRLSPHALAFDGSRWHTRAWCHTRSEFRDFVIGRIFGVRSQRRTEIEPRTDLGWNTHVTLRIAPHPELNDGARRITELDYGMESGFKEFDVRACLVPYFVRREGLDRSPSRVTPQEQQVVLLNHQEVSAAIRKVGVSLSIEERKKPE